MRSLYLILSIWMSHAIVIHADTSKSKPFADLVPAMVRISYDHDMWGSVQVELKNRKIIYTSNGGGVPVVIEPTLNQWSKFIAALNDAKIYEWQGFYRGGQGVGRDGNYHWHVEFQIGERHFASDGDTAFPFNGVAAAKNSRTGSASFDLLDKAISDLIGRDFL